MGWLIFLAILAALGDHFQGPQKVLHIVLIPVAAHLFQGLRLLCKQAPADFISGLQLRHGQTNLLHGLPAAALDQSLTQQVQLILCLLLLGGGEKHLCLDQHQMGGHGDKLTGDLHIQPLHLIQVGKVLLQNGCNGDILNLDLVLAQQQKNHIQRPLKILPHLCAGMDNALQPVLGFRHTSIPLPSNSLSPEKERTQRLSRLFQSK